MNVVGIIAEYNPFHNGHVYQINKIKKLFKNSIIIVILNGNFTQRADVSVINKWDKTRILLDNNVDMVVELPIYYGINNADIFAEGALKILNELNSLNVTGTKIQKNIIIVPINNTLLYVEPIYQIMLNDKSQVPQLKKVVVASGNKVAIGNNIEEAITNLLSQEAISIEVEAENKDELIKQIINANKNLEESNKSNNWEMIGKDMSKLQQLIEQLQTLVEQDEKKEAEIEKNEPETNKNQITTNTAVTE